MTATMNSSHWCHSHTIDSPWLQVHFLLFRYPEMVPFFILVNLVSAMKKKLEKEAIKQEINDLFKIWFNPCLLASVCTFVVDSSYPYHFAFLFFPYLTSWTSYLYFRFTHTIMIINWSSNKSMFPNLLVLSNLCSQARGHQLKLTY